MDASVGEKQPEALLHEAMTHDELERLLEQHTAVRLLRAANAPLLLSFLHRGFIEPNRRAVPAGELIAALDDTLAHLHERLGAERYPKAAKDYLEDWSGASGYLRKYYPPRSDEPEFDLTPGAEKAIEWIGGLQARQFVGTESRLLALFEQLRELAVGAEADPAVRERELLTRRQEIDRELDRLRAGIVETLDATRVKERYFQLEDTARRLLGDFRQVEDNFRRLDRQTRERIATSDLAKGALLTQIFGEQDHIRDTDQGRSFAAFWELLMSPQRQDALNAWLDAVHKLEAVQALRPSGFLGDLPYALLAAGEKVQRTAAALVEQLRKFLDDQAHLENRRILELIRGIEKNAVAVRERPPTGEFASLDELKPDLELPLSRSLFVPPAKPVIDTMALEAGQADIALDPLLEQVYVDEDELRSRIAEALRGRSQISLPRLAELHPLRQGVAEVVAYLKIASRGEAATIDESIVDTLLLPTAADGRRRSLRVPRVIFLRAAGSGR